MNDCFDPGDLEESLAYSQRQKPEHGHSIHVLIVTSSDKRVR